MDKPRSTSCKTEAALLASLALAESRWFFLIDDDSVVRTRMAAAALGRYDGAVERHAFGAYPCGSRRRAPTHLPRKPAWAFG